MSRSFAAMTVACVAGLATLGAPEARALVITAGCAGGDFGAACSLAELTAGGSLRINDKLFDQWDLSALGIGLPNPPTTDQTVIRVDPIDSQNDPGFTLVDTGSTWRFSNDGTHPVNGDGVAQLFDHLVYRVSTIDGVARIKDNTLIVEVGDITDNPPGTTTHASVIETLFGLGLNKIANCGVDPNPDPATCANSTLTAHLDFAPVASLIVQKDISLRADDPGDLAEINTITQRFSQVPEPAAFLLLGTGFGVILAFRRRDRFVLAARHG